MLIIILTIGLPASERILLLARLLPRNIALALLPLRELTPLRDLVPVFERLNAFRD